MIASFETNENNTNVINNNVRDSKRKITKKSLSPNDDDPPVTLTKNNESFIDVEQKLGNILAEENLDKQERNSGDNFEEEYEKIDRQFNSAQLYMQECFVKRKQAESEYNKAIKLFSDIAIRYQKKYHKIENKKQQQKDRRSENPGGIHKPVPITNELAIFLGVPFDMKVSCTDLTRFLSKYTHDHNLRDNTTRQIKLDEKLQKLMKNASENDSCEWKYLINKMKHHFLPSQTSQTSHTSPVHSLNERNEEEERRDPENSNNNQESLCLE